MTARLAVFVASVSLTVTVPLSAHHASSAEFDATKALRLMGA